MTISLPFVLWLTFTHWLADWVVQTREQAEAKHRSLKALSAHVVTYTMTLWYLLACAGLLVTGFATLVALTGYVAINGALHWVTDYYTSRLNARLWRSGNQQAFWVALGADGLIHLWTLLLTAAWLIGP